MEILRPLQELIYNSNYPGVRKNDLWYSKCKELRFFDCSYEIAKNYDLYCSMKKRLTYDLGDAREEVKVELEKYYRFWTNNKQDEKTLFCNMMLDVFKRIINDKFDLGV